MSYESPIKTFIGQMQMRFENGVYEAVQDLGITVDKEELTKALQYDRHQYQKGYDDGYADGFDADRWIPISDGLPKDFQQVLILSEEKHITIGYRYQGCWLIEGVTHWMPLPKLPKEVQ